MNARAYVREYLALSARAERRMQRAYETFARKERRSLPEVDRKGLDALWSTEWIKVATAAVDLLNEDIGAEKSLRANTRTRVRVEAVRRARLIQSETSEQIAQTVRQALKQRLSAAETAALLRQRHSELTAGRAATIARTEVNAAMNYGMFLEASEREGMRKEWIATSTKPRPAHAAASGQRRKVDEPFSVGGEAMMYPHDGRASARNTVNCRCTVRYLR